MRPSIVAMGSQNQLVWRFSTCLCQHWGFHVDSFSHQGPGVGVGCFDLVHAQRNDSVFQLRKNQRRLLNTNIVVLTHLNGINFILDDVRI